MITSLRAYAAIIHNDKILLTKDVGDKGWKFPGGHVEEGESFEKGVIREIKEEVGLEAEIDRWVLEERYCKADRPDFLVHKMFYMVKAKIDQVVIDPKEVETYKWFSFDEFLALPLEEIYKLHLGAFLRVRKILEK